MSGCGSIKAVRTEVAAQNIYRDYVLYKCIIRAFDNDPVFSKDISLSVYNDVAKYPLGAGLVGRKLDSLAVIKVNSIKPSIIADYEGKKAIFMQCLDYYNSKKLRDEIKVILKQALLQKRQTNS
ncbi:T6SS amidase immunity protein Tai4 family protein [Mucilaginibacter antarcticus]|uniref:T6SS amidase immunity protein Tai4 family protein n=1 Tax=Mucilaginibacter antarcticus TaxID=1855725 RepID=UPI003635D31A